MNSKISNDLIIDKGYQYLSKAHSLIALALFYHRTHQNKPIRFENHKYLKKIYLDKSNHIVIIKSTQCGISEFNIVRSIHDAMRGLNVFYILPTDIIKARFVQSRFNKTLNMTPYYKYIQNELDSASMKSFNDGVINFSGSNAEASFTEFVANTVIIDEKDQCNQQNIIMARERQSAQTEKYTIEVSNPTIVNFGIDQSYKISNQQEWVIKCDSCNKHFSPDFFKNIVTEIEEDKYLILDKDYEHYQGKDCRIICDCGKPVDRFKDGEWIIRNSSSIISGYRINKLFSTAVTISELIENFKVGLKNERILQRFYNADLGQAYTSKGAKINREMIDNCLGDYSNGIHQKALGLAGIDVNATLNIVIGYLLPDGRVMVAYILEIPPDENELVRLLNEYNVRVTVIDAMPERNFVNKIKHMYMNVFSCYYAESKKDPVDESRNIKVDRTATLDYVKEGLMTKSIILPANSESIPGFYDQMMSSTRIFDQKRNKGSGAYVWVESAPDHYFHSMNYLLQARRLIAAVSK